MEISPLQTQLQDSLLPSPSCNFVYNEHHACTITWVLLTLPYRLDLAIRPDK